MPGITGPGGRPEAFDPAHAAGSPETPSAPGSAPAASAARAASPAGATQTDVRLGGFTPARVQKGPAGTTFEGGLGRGSASAQVRLDPAGNLRIRSQEAGRPAQAERPLSLSERNDLLGALARFVRDPGSDPEIQRLDAALRTFPNPLPKPGGPASDSKKDVLCPVLGAMIKEGKIKLDANGNMDLVAFDAMLQKDMHFSRPLAAATAGVGPLANRPQDILGNVLGAKMNPLELRKGNVHHAADSMILTKGKFDEAKFQALVSHATDAKVVNGKVVSGRVTIEDCAEIVRANVKRDGVLSGYLEGIPSGVAELAALLSMFGQLNSRTGKREISVEALRGLYERKELPKPAGTAANPAQLRDFTAIAAEITWKLPGASPTGIARDGARAAAGLDPSGITPAMLGAAKGVCPHMQGLASAAAPVNAAEIRALSAARSAAALVGIR